MTVEPVVSDRRVRWGMVLAAIEGKLKEIVSVLVFWIFFSRVGGYCDESCFWPFPSILLHCIPYSGL